MNKVITKVHYEITLDADPTRTEVVLRSDLVENFSRDNELPNLLSNYKKPFNDDKPEHFYNEYGKYRISQLNQPINSFVERQHLNDYLPIFLDTCEPSQTDTTIKLPVKDNGCHSRLNLLASSPDSGIPQPFPHTPLSFQSESPVITSQTTAPRPLPCTSSINPTNLSSTFTGTTPRPRSAGLYEIFLASGTESHTSSFSVIFYYFSASFSINLKNFKKTRQVVPNKSYAIQSICIIYNFNFLNTTSGVGVSVELQHLVFLYNHNI